MSPDDVAKAVEGYTVIRHRGQVFVQPRTDEEMTRLENLGASVSSVLHRGQVIREAFLAPMLDAPTETDEDGNVIDNRAALLLDYFRERDGYAEPWPESWR